MLQGAAHQAAQGFVICLVSFELPSAACELPHHSATHGCAHGAIRTHHAIHEAIRMSIQGAVHTLITLVRSPVNHHMYSDSLGNSPCFRLRTGWFTMLCKAFALSSVFH